MIIILNVSSPYAGRTTSHAPVVCKSVQVALRYRDLEGASEHVGTSLDPGAMSAVTE